jgi:colanic acid biosynthesis glycosyl transferase WcaI
VLMHFVILTQYYPPEIGAPQARLSELAARFVKRGHRVTVVTGMPNYPTGKILPGYGGMMRVEQRDGVRVIRAFIYATKSAKFGLRMANYLSFVASSVLIGTLALPRADFILVESPPLFLGLSAIWLSWLKHARLIFNVSDLWPESVVRLGKLAAGSRAHRLMIALEKFCYRRAWLVSGQSAGILADLRQRFPGKLQFDLSNGVDPNFFRPDRRAWDLRRELGDEGHNCLAVYAGLHGLAQGLEQLLAIAAQLRDLIDLKIVLIGDGPEKEALQARTKELQLENVRFLPPLPRDRMPAVAASADIALVPLKLTLPGAVPSKIYEAMGSGVPILLIAGGEPAEIIARTGSGIAVPVDDVAAGTAALRRLAADAGLRAVLGAAGRRAAEEEFNRDIIVARFIDFLEREIPCRSAGLSSPARIT